jgi:membrane protein YqaA with SNARE-associated domain
MVFDQIEHWLMVLAIAVGLNAVPAFMPPTWSVLAYFHVREGLAIFPLAMVGAIGATIGRAMLALMSREVGTKLLPERWGTNIEALATELQRRRELGFLALALFALGPVPSNQLFIAAGIARAPLAPILAVFAVARFASYVVWITVADTAVANLAEVVSPRFGAEAATIVQVAAFLALIGVMQLDWRRIFRAGQRGADVSE